jgi:hypothetical protein
MSATPPERGRRHGDTEQAVGGGRARALILDHHLIPEHTHSRLVDDATAAYRWLLDQGISGDHIAFTGGPAAAGCRSPPSCGPGSAAWPSRPRRCCSRRGHGSHRGVVRNQPGPGRLLLHGGRTRVGGISWARAATPAIRWPTRSTPTSPASERYGPNLVASRDASSIAPAMWRGQVGLWSRPPLRHPHSPAKTPREPGPPGGRCATVAPSTDHRLITPPPRRPATGRG